MLGAGIGLVAGVSPGPLLTLVVAETLKGGWLRGAAVAAGPLLADRLCRGLLLVSSLILATYAAVLVARGLQTAAERTAFDRSRP